MIRIMIELLEKRTVNHSWDFRKSDTKMYSHCYHSYPAMMIPQIARRLLKEYKPKNAKLLFDPYCGSGTSLVESKLIGLNSIGTDLNPLARLITRAKYTDYNINEIIKANRFFYNEIMTYSSSKTENIQLANITNIDYWFSKPVIQKLNYLRNLILNMIDEKLCDFFLLPYSEMIREASYTRNSEFKLYRIPQQKIVAHKVDPFRLFLEKIERNLRGLKEYLKHSDKKATAEVYGFNTCNKMPEDVFKGKEIDIIVTSPPYGDSRTTVAYGQFSRLSNQWLGIKNANQIDKILMGGTNNHSYDELQLASAEMELIRIKNEDEKRYKEVMAFLIDYSKSIKNIAKYIRKGGVVCYVVGNRTVKKVQIPLDLITAELFQNNRFKHMTTIIRSIPNKKMPKKNSPTNQVGQLVNTMNNEYIVILKKL